MITAHFMVDGAERETREVEEEWLRKASQTRENVLLRDGNTYWVKDVEYLDGGQARVHVVPPQFARAS